MLSTISTFSLIFGDDAIVNNLGLIAFDKYTKV